MKFELLQITASFKKDIDYIPVVKLNKHGVLEIDTSILKENPFAFSLKPISKFISEDRYRHLGLLFCSKQTYVKRLENTFYLFNGRHFDAEYSGLPALGLLDLSLIPLLAQQLFRASLNKNLDSNIQDLARYISLPIIILKAIVAVLATLLLALPVYGMHLLIQVFKTNDVIAEHPEDEDSNLDTTTVNSSLS